MNREFQNFQQLVLRVPEHLSERVQNIVKGGSSTKHVEVFPQDDRSPTDDFLFCIEEEIYPALLVNLPCNVETYKTLDHLTYFKSGDIGQMLVVFDNVELREETRSSLRKIDGVYYSSSGITPPTTDIVKRRYERLFEYGPYPNYQMTDVEEKILEYRPNDGIEEIYEEVVPFESWMVDASNPTGITITITGEDWTSDSHLLQSHPELLRKRVDQQVDEEEEEAKHLILAAKTPLPSTSEEYEKAATALALKRGHKPRESLVSMSGAETELQVSAYNTEEKKESEKSGESEKMKIDDGTGVIEADLPGQSEKIQTESVVEEEKEKEIEESNDLMVLNSDSSEGEEEVLEEGGLEEYTQEDGDEEVGRGRGMTGRIAAALEREEEEGEEGLEEKEQRRKTQEEEEEEEDDIASVFGEEEDEENEEEGEEEEEEGPSQQEREGNGGTSVGYATGGEGEGEGDTEENEDDNANDDDEEAGDDDDSETWLEEIEEELVGPSDT